MKPIRIAWRRGGYQSASKAGHTASLFSTLRQEKSGGTHPAADVLYKNPEAIANRLNLFHMLRLQVQARIDCPALQRTALVVACVYLPLRDCESISIVSRDLV